MSSALPASLLVADPSPLTCLGLRHLLIPDARYVLHETLSEETLLVAVRASTPTVVLLGANLPAPEGVLGVVLRLRRVSPQLPIIVLFDDALPEATLLQLLQVNCNGLLHRMAPLQDVRNTIELVLQQGQFYDEHVSRLLHRRLTAYRLPPPLIAFTPREKEVLHLLGEDLTSAAVAARLCLSPRTIEFHRHRMLQKTGTRTTLGLLLFVVRQGLLDI